MTLFDDVVGYVAYLTWETEVAGQRWSGGYMLAERTLKNYRGDISVPFRRIVRRWKKFANEHP
ncbi:hypothetical protein LCGC14_2533370 [marine sediment metagenome]|uniref:Uncharacterized protein n=1 Tax=marine sediment metagenome TaxID=412755 RepID=A0A0F9AT96_9ZZZZ